MPQDYYLLLKWPILDVPIYREIQISSKKSFITSTTGIPTRSSSPSINISFGCQFKVFAAVALKHFAFNFQPFFSNVPASESVNVAMNVFKRRVTRPTQTSETMNLQKIDRNCRFCEIDLRNFIRNLGEKMAFLKSLIFVSDNCSVILLQSFRISLSSSDYHGHLCELLQLAWILPVAVVRLHHEDPACC